MESDNTAPYDGERILESLNDAVYAVDADGCIQFCNAALARLTGYDVKTLRGRPATELYRPDDRAALQNRRQPAFSGEVMPPLVQATLIRRDGTQLPVELSISNLMHNGAVTARLVVVRDSGLRQPNQVLLHTNAEHFRLLIEGVHDYAIYMLDPTGHITSWNPGAARIKGYSAAEVLGTHFSRFYTPEDIASGLPAYGLGVAAREGRFKSEGWRLRRDGSRFWADATITALYDAAGGLRGFAKVTRDVTQRHESERALEQARADLEQRVAERTADLQALNMQLEASLQEKEILLKEIHHRVKNNLQVIASLLYLQSDQLRDPDDLALFEDTQNRIKSMALVHESLYRSGDLAHFNFAQYIRDLSTRLVESSMLEGSQIHLRMELDEIAFDVDTAVPCGLILNELLTNALKYAFPDSHSGEICIRLRRETGHVVLSVQDTGIGFPQEIDYRNPESLGLQLVYLLTAQLRGQMTLDRHGGTTFIVTFPDPLRPAKEEAHVSGANSDRRG